MAHSNCCHSTPHTAPKTDTHALFFGQIVCFLYACDMRVTNELTGLRVHEHTHSTPTGLESFCLSMSMWMCVFRFIHFERLVSERARIVWFWENSLTTAIRCAGLLLVRSDLNSTLWSKRGWTTCGGCINMFFTTAYSLKCTRMFVVVVVVRWIITTLQL